MHSRWGSYVMEASHQTHLRLYQDLPDESPKWNAHRLASQELLRPVSVPARSRDIEPFSRAWFEALEVKRYAPHGAWLHRILEFTRHGGETLLMIGAGIGSDALQYQRHGVEVTILATPAEPAELVERNFELRGLACALKRGELDQKLPFADGAFDLAYLNLIHTNQMNGSSLVAELYRVLKPGGKVFVLAPAWYDVNFWSRLLVPYRQWYRKPEPLTEAPAYSGRMLKRLFAGFTEVRLSKRQLRTSDLPYIWRFLPLAILERLLGRVIAFRAFKPLSAALEGLSGSDKARWPHSQTA